MTSPAPPDRVFDYLCVPRNLLLANHQGPVEARSSDPTTRAGSWAVLAFDQLRVRVEYTAVERAERVEAVMEWSGFGSGNRRETVEYRLTPLPGGGTEVTVASVGPSRSAPLIGRLLGRLTAGRVRRRFRERFEAIGGSPE